MGKYKKSRLNDLFSDWVYQNTRKDNSLTDIDKLWIFEPDYKPVAVFDLKEPGAGITTAQRIAYDWFESKELPVYIVFALLSLKYFRIRRWKSGEEKSGDGSRFIEWINNLKDRLF